ncbi:MAG: TIGR04282 family arsenosugar biosynthesis glycosyltransferase [Pseudomonadota bacterium]|nr:TIGR04282 family arsenosugar biosynthesis glycosyltransferase [Pseudomonadota bacterium]
MKPVRIVIFAKAPVPGRVKTRLIPALGAAGAARLAARMLDLALEQALEAAVGPVELCMSPAPGVAAWAAIPLPAAIETSDQGEGDLGERMARAARRVIENGESVLLIGTDCPQLTAARLSEAAARLAEHEAVLHRAEDGGYPLLGLQAFDASLFEDIPWSTSAVADLTLARMRALKWRVWLGDALHDIDEAADLVHLPAHLRAAMQLHRE